jgi:hypothetical protein
VTVKGLDAPDAVKEPGVDVTVYEVIGNFEVEGAEKEIDADPLLYARPDPALEAETDVGTVGAGFAPLDEAPMIGIGVFYPNLAERDLATRQQLQA